METTNNAIWRDWYLAIQGLFYFAQGAAFAAILLIPVFMQNELGILPEDSIGYQAIIMLPWYIKIIFGVLSDNVPIKALGRRKPYIIIAGIFGIFGWFIFPTFTEYSPLILVVGIFMALSVALADTVLDSLMVDITPPNRRSLVQGVGWSARGLGSFVAGILLGVLISQINYAIAYTVVGVMMVGGCFSTILVKEPKEIDGKTIKKVTFSEFKAGFKKPGIWIVTGFNLCVGAGIALIGVLSTFLNSSLGIDIENLGWSYAMFSIGQFVGAITMGLLAHKFDLGKILTLNTFLYIIVIALFLVYPFSNLAALYVLLVILGAINGGYEANQMTLSMEFSTGKISGTMYSWFMSMSNVAQLALGSVLIGNLAASLGNYPLAMQIASVFLVLALLPAFKALKLLKK
jgi:MFS family permease